MDFDELFHQVRQEVGGLGDKARAMIMAVEAALETEYDPAPWRSRSLLGFKKPELYAAMVNAIRRVVDRSADPQDQELREIAVSVDKSFRDNITRATRADLEALKLSYPPPDPPPQLATPPPPPPLKAAVVVPPPSPARPQRKAARS